jgi:hypothetical protein
MAYFRELPDLQYPSPFKTRNYIDEFVTTKNIFRRAKLRTDVANYATAFTYYQISDNERPEQIAQKIYDNPELDWIILLTNNITNLNEEWPLDNDSLYKYMLQKYGSDEELAKIHHYETVEYKDKYGRVLVEGGLQVDPAKSETIQTNQNTNEYLLSSFPSAKSNTVISINLCQKLTIYGRDIRTSEYLITDIQTNISNLKVKSKTGTNNFGDVTVVNSLADWPYSWGGVLKVKRRTGDEVDVQLTDAITDIKIRVPERLYEITGTLIDGVLQPTFKFTNELPA